MMLRGSPVVDTIFDATADTPNAIEPARLSAAMRHEMLRDAPRPPAVAHLEPGETAGDEEADRTDHVGHPHEAVRLRGVEARVEGGERRHVEEHGAHQLHRARRPVDAGGLPRPEAEAPITGTGVGPRSECMGRVQRLQVLQVRGRREEDRADEERDGIGVGPDPTDVAGERPDGEAQGADREQRADPPADRSGCPPRGAAAGVEATGLLPVLAGRPLDHLAVGRAEALVRDERTEPHGVGARPARGRQDVGARQERQPTTVARGAAITRLG